MRVDKSMYWGPHEENRRVGGQLRRASIGFLKIPRSGKGIWAGVLFCITPGRLRFKQNKSQIQTKYKLLRQYAGGCRLVIPTARLLLFPLTGDERAPQRFITETVERATGPLPDAGIHGIPQAALDWLRKASMRTRTLMHQLSLNDDGGGGGGDDDDDDNNNTRNKYY